MRRDALAVLGLAAVLFGCRPAGPPPTAAPPSAGLPRAEPVVRVGLAVDVAEVVVGAEAPFEIVGVGGEVLARSSAGETWTFTADAERRVVGRTGAGRRVGPSAAPVRVQVRGGTSPVLIGGQPYRGGALIRSSAPGRVTAINVLELEEYLLGVVPLEIGARPVAELEAVKAQAVAARTYAVGHLGGREARGFDFFATVADQVYGGFAKEDPVTSRAVRETRGEIVSYDGLPILAYYHSTCGGRTASIEEVWQHRAPVPYLKSVSDEIEGQKGRYYCESSNRFRWTVSWTGEQLREILANGLTARRGGNAVRRVEDVHVTGRTRSGRVEAIEIRTDGGTYRIQGDSIRWILKPPANTGLNSTLFVLDQEKRGGEVRSLQAKGGGWGHGIGMCQMGAIGRARAGQRYDEILTTYYRGTKVIRLY